MNLPRVVKAERQYLTHEEVENLAQACATFGQDIISKHRRLTERRRDDYRLIVLFLDCTGLRFTARASIPGTAGLAAMPPTMSAVEGVFTTQIQSKARRFVSN